MYYRKWYEHAVFVRHEDVGEKHVRAVFGRTEDMGEWRRPRLRT